MKIIVCVNDCAHGLKLAEYTNRLRFPNAEYHFVHGIQPIMSAPLDIDSGASAVTYADAQRVTLTGTKELLHNLAAEFHRLHGFTCKSFVSCGLPTAVICDYAEQIKADLIVVGRTELGPVGRLFLGSVSRGIVIGAKTTVLVVETPVPEGTHALHAVMATDHSPYANQCIEHLYQLSPHGIDRLTILSVYNQRDRDQIHILFPAEADEFVRDHTARLEHSNNSLADEFKHLVPIVETNVEIGQLRETIRQEMEATKSELLILGAHGHSLLKRTLLGSLSFHQVFGEPYSVLIMRV